MTDTTSALIASLSAICPAFDQRVTAHDAAYYRVDSIPAASLTTTLGSRPRARDTFSVVAVSNNPSGARILARKALTLLDGLRVDGFRVTHDTTGPVLEDTSDTTNWRWSCTGVYHITTPRS